MDCWWRYYIRETLENKNIKYSISLHPPRTGEMNPQVLTSFTTNKSKTIDSIIEFANEYKFDEIDFDWEYPRNNEEFSAYNVFLRDLKAQMILRMHNKEDAKLLIAVGNWGLENYEQ